MIKLNIPPDDLKSAFDSSTISILDEVERQKYNDNYSSINNDCNEYVRLAQRERLFTIPWIVDIRSNPEVYLNITKKELNNLYSYYFVKREPGRAVYMRIKLHSMEICPFCGGIGSASNVDHFLPKANYPQFSIFPGNLVPVCRDCNTEKSNKIYPLQEMQILHPYYDANHYYCQRWVFAKILSINPLLVSFEAIPPRSWSDIDSYRVKNHFKQFDLAKRYSIQARSEIPTIVSQRSNSLRSLSSETYRSHLEAAITLDLPINHWKRALYECLSNDERIVYGFDWLNP